MESQLTKVMEWMDIGGQTIRLVPTVNIREEEWRLRRRLMNEELKELMDAMRDQDIVAIADGIADLMYVVLGTAVTYGIDADAIFDIVHENNMTKFLKCEHAYEPERRSCPQCKGKGIRAIHDQGGKVLKQPDWVPPTAAVMADLERQGYGGKWLAPRYGEKEQA